MAERQLPQDIIDRGFKLIIRAPDRMFAVSTNRGGTSTKATIEEVVTEARKMAAWCEWMDENWNTSAKRKYDEEVQPAP